ncbi:hypothetical protein PUR61_08590 [Streptomyces sp. BE20]|uniref:hypothetical protein n=1 Tax=Streptomycetaceae TaxID=2062 RepID=UPI002E7A4A4E|nr:MULTISPECIES: hypothetical protein [unclassified Streptomyces]MED7948119.1 hypothetical protein [Streptomyces sp. BE303]MEE1822250.1 hypothetical protein [Streptomyces sp. BE20]
MARLHVRTGINPDDPDAPVVALLVDPEGPPGEQAVAKLGWYGHEGDGALFLLPTDGWAEHALDGDRLAVEVAVYPFTLEQIGADPADFPARSPIVPEATLVLRAETAVDPALYARAADTGTAVFTAAPDRTLDEVLAGDDAWPVLLSPPPAPDADAPDDLPDPDHLRG